MPIELKESINFINISSSEGPLFEWKPTDSHRSYILDLNVIKNEVTTEDIFFHMDKGNLKIAYFKKGNIIYTAGAQIELQFQLMEALLEEIARLFNEIYDVDVILSYGNVSENTFQGFRGDVENILENFEQLGLVRKITAQCRVCKRQLPVYVKKSFVENAESYPVSIVYNHKGHALLLYIDKNFAVRGIELVSITG